MQLPGALRTRCSGSSECLPGISNNTATSPEIISLSGNGGSGSPPQPTVTAVNPNNVTAGESVTISGSNFTTNGTTTIAVGSASASHVNCSSTTSCTLTVPAGTGTVHVTTVATVSSAPTSADLLTYVAPTITSVAPASGPTTDGGMPVTITGTNLAAVSKVDFGTAMATAQGCSYTSCTVTLPKNTAGSMAIQATTFRGNIEHGKRLVHIWSARHNDQSSLEYILQRTDRYRNPSELFCDQSWNDRHTAR